MAERHRSKDGHRETKEIIGEAADIDQKGRASGDLERRVATRDEEKRAQEKPAGATRVTGQDKRETGHAPEEDV
ncbi:hypothetical protein [Roseovarius aquimarinus]|uniref:CsbD-like protein n=1 Tax=Roseovarius aquimarinus TaxID=1229156 RepID=A0ABW7I5G9_9RHOB